MDSAGLEALEERRGCAVLHTWRVVAVAGSDALPWLHDLVTAGVEGLAPGEARRSLFLWRTGQMKADFHVVGSDNGVLLIQDPIQQPIDQLLAMYVLSSDVEISDQTVGGVAWTATAGLGVADLPYEGLTGGVGTPPDALEAATAEDVEVWRIRRGIPRFGVDFGDDTLPSEAGLDHLVDTTKGCFLGQEAVAKVRNLGHPRWQVLAFTSDRHVSPAAQVYAGDDPIGRVTSVAPARDGGWALIARVRWEARDAALTAESGAPLALRA